MSITGNSKGQATRWLLNQPGQQLDIRASIERLAPGLEVLELKIRQSLNISEKEQVQNHAESLIEGGMPKTLAYRAASLHLLLPALDVVEMAARRKTDVLGVAGVFFGLAESLSLGWLRESVENLAVEGQWHAHARSNLRDELYSQHRRLVGRILDEFPKEKDAIKCWLSANSKAVERVSLMMTDMQGLQSMDYATVSEAVRSLKLLSEEMEFT